jgi:hypothetical protein
MMGGKRRSYYLGKKEEVLNDLDRFPYLFEDYTGRLRVMNSQIDIDKHVVPLENARLAAAHAKKEKKRLKEWKARQAMMRTVKRTEGETIFS